MEELLNVFGSGWSMAALVTAVGILLNWILKRWVTQEALDKVGTTIYSFFKGIGVAVTLGLSKLPYLKVLWNNTLEPYVILALRTVLQNMLAGIVAGMETDNKSTK